MQTITLIRRRSGFANVRDGFRLDAAGGYDESSGDERETYALPSGYTVGVTVAEEPAIFDPTGTYCAILENPASRRPQLVGSSREMPVLEPVLTDA